MDIIIPYACKTQNVQLLNQLGHERAEGASAQDNRAPQQIGLQDQVLGGPEGYLVRGVPEEKGQDEAHRVHLPVRQVHQGLGVLTRHAAGGGRQAGLRAEGAGGRLLGRPQTCRELLISYNRFYSYGRCRFLGACGDEAARPFCYMCVVFYYLDWRIGLQLSFYFEMAGNLDACQNLSDSQAQFLQPVCRINPANELISKDYAPDEKPILKLMRIQKPEPGTCLQLRNKYKTIFSPEDTLGYQHAYSLSNEVVYIKFNNHNYFKCKIKNSSYKFLAGMFVSPEQILAPEVKNTKNIYRTLQDIEFVQYKNNVEESFDRNSRYTNAKTLKFSSNYESANLFLAMKKKQNQYDLILQNDINSKGNIQWFNFAVEFNQEGVYKFNILNFTKSYSQFQDGMKILYYSYGDQEEGKAGWARGCDNIRYEESYVKREESEYKKYYCLKFEFKCKYAHDKVVFSYFYPYTSLDLQKFLKKTIYRKINVHMKMQKIKICESPSGLPIYAISVKYKRSQKLQTISSSPSSPTSSAPAPKPRKTAVFMARQHPGESQGSFVAEGVIEMLMQNGELEQVKKGIDFLVFPMVNVDGVLYGNYRTNISGADLNRIWRSPKKEFHPEVYYIKKYLQIVNKTSPISMIVDLHGHSKSYNSFFYGNPPKKDVITGTSEDPRLFPFVCSKKIRQISFTQSTFHITEDKKNSARVVLSEMFPRAHVYTLQHSFHGWKKENNTIVEYTPQILRRLGKELVLTYLQYDKLCQKNPQIKQKWTKEMIEMKLKTDSKLMGSDDGGSDSQAQFQLIDLELPEERPTHVSVNRSAAEKSLFNNSVQIPNILRKQEKEQLIPRNIVLRTQSQQKVSYNKYKRKVYADSPITEKIKRETIDKKSSNLAIRSGFLSIIKIKTPTDAQALSEKEINTKDEPTKNSKPNEIKFTKENIIEKLRKKKIKIEQAVSSCTGMKSFLRSMGIPLQRKHPILKN